MSSAAVELARRDRRILAMGEGSPRERFDKVHALSHRVLFARRLTGEVELLLRGEIERLLAAGVEDAERLAALWPGVTDG